MTSNARKNSQNVAREHWDSKQELIPGHPIGLRPEPTTQVRSDPWQSVSALQLGFQPRSFGELHTERLYLLEMLQQYDRRAFELFTKVPLVEHRACQVDDPARQKRAKKHRGWLRHRIVDTVEEEKKILARLSELHVEIQCRERWSRVEKERERIHLTPQHLSDYPDLPTYPRTPWGPRMYPLPPQLYDPQFQYYMYTGTPHMYYERPIWNHDTPTYGQNTSNNNSKPEEHELDGTPIDSTQDYESRQRSQSLGELTASRPKKQNSMPSLGRRWSGQDEENVGIDT
ncbi:uncharacterized protein GGS22DRAFT_63876 [Annulohypoxylon maeteangense]|uniref:uncharacterized protein n=1 Tax=Annulohypoxylon maeteangense TaxID=1927788 RepID=UPI002007F37F|nr:uncharacterized protein GGS22DRAFT_63876 [Annulohypoxylon maeteangense]KAI0888865.1 hypothetical protein GGS22DRAFT_63876 [Annulohypoxylon maeteangense]